MSKYQAIRKINNIYKRTSAEIKITTKPIIYSKDRYMIVFKFDKLTPTNEKT